MNMKQVKSAYLIGIGGIGMSAVARYFNHIGAEVSGYDRTETPLTKKMEDEGIKIFFEENVSRIPQNPDLVVYTPAIPKSHSELAYYQNTNVPLLKRAVILGKIVNEGDCFAVAGSHGKSTTSAMLAHVFQTAGKNCTAFLGAIASNYNSNFIAGGSDCFVVEADEFDRSFHQIKALSTIITSVDSDHLDIYGSMEGVEKGFLEYLEGLREDGTIFIHAEDDFQQKITKTFFTYGLNQNADYQAKNIQLVNGAFQFDIVGPKSLLINGIRLKMGGKYNVENALAVIAMTSYYGVEADKIKEAFSTFKGLKRRFEIVLDQPGMIIIDDYAHHPNEIRAFIKGVRELYPNKRIGAIFQPHLYTRTRDYADHFAESLDLVDEALVMNIYPAREDAIPGVTSELIINAMKKKAQLVSKSHVAAKAKELNVDVLATIGAGDISKCVNEIKNEFIE